MGAQIKRMRRDREYLYYACYEGGRRKETYCGPTASPESGKKALECERDYLTGQIDEIRKRIQEIQDELDNLKQVRPRAVPSGREKRG